MQESSRHSAADYYQYAVKRDKDTYVVYLTLHGTMPSKYSLGSKDGSYMLEFIKC